MYSKDDFLKDSDGKATPYKNYQATIEEEVSDKLIVCIPDIHLLEKDATDDFYLGDEKNLNRFTEFVDFLISKKDNLEVIQLGDMFDLWQARGNTNLIYEAYPNILGLIDNELDSTFVIGNHGLTPIE